MKRPRTPLDQIEFMRNLLAFGLVSAFVGALIAFTLLAIPEANKDILTYMVGQLSGMATTALGFYFVNKVGQDALDAKKTENTAKAFDALAGVTKLAQPESDEAAAEAAQDTAAAAKDKADEIAESAQ